MKSVLRFAGVLAVLVVLILLVRQFACTVMTVTDNSLAPQLRAGDRLLVNRLAADRLQKGKWIVFSDSLNHVGRLLAMPGDTVQIDSLDYLIPDTCCSRCDCEGCQLLLVDMGKSQVLVRRKHVLGSATRLFNLKIWW